MTDHIDAPISRMCAEGQALRLRYLWTAAGVRQFAWMADGLSLEDRANMLETANRLSAPDHDAARNEWQEHFSTCEACRGALTWPE